MRAALLVAADPRGHARPFSTGEPIFLDEWPAGVTIGRLRGELRIEWDRMQRRSCRVFAEGGIVYVGNVNSRGGVFVNGVHLRENTERHALQNGDRIAFGSWGSRVAECTTVLRVEFLDEDPLQRAVAVGPWFVLDDAIEQGGIHRGFAPGVGLLHIVASALDDTDSWVGVAGLRDALPPLMGEWRDRRFVYRAFVWNGGARLGNLLNTLGEGVMDRAVAARILLDVTRAASVAWDAAGINLDLWDLQLGWTGTVCLLPRPAMPSSDFDVLALGALFRALVPNSDESARFSPFSSEEWTFAELDEAVRAFASKVGSVADDATLAALVCSGFPRQHEADRQLLEQVQLMAPSPPPSPQGAG